MTSRRIYVATSWRNKHHSTVVDALRNERHLVYDFKNPPNGPKGFAWSDISENWKHWSAAEYRYHLYASPIAAQGFMNDFRGMQWADTCVLVLPSGRSAHLEAGWFTGQNKPVYILTEDGQEPELMALLATDIVLSIRELIRKLGV